MLSGGLVPISYYSLSVAPGTLVSNCSIVKHWFCFLQASYVLLCNTNLFKHLITSE